MRIALVTETYPPQVNGVAMTLQRLARGLVRRGHHVLIIRPRQGAEPLGVPAGPRPREIIVPGAPLPRYPDMTFGYPARRRLQHLWDRFQPDVVHVATEGPLGWSACAAARRLGIPVGSSYHTQFHMYSDFYGLGFLQAPALRYLCWFHNRTRYTLTPAPEVAAILTRAGCRGVGVLSRGVDAQLFTPDKRDPRLRAQWGAAPDQPVALYVGRIAAEKNLQLAVTAFLALQKRASAARFVLVGEGPIRAAFQRQHPQFIYAGVQRGADLARHYASADIFLFPSLTETFGNVVLEAMASGLAVVCFNYAAALQHIRTGVNGLATPPDAESPFIAAACTLAADPALTHTLGQAARQTALGITWDAIIDQFAQVLRAAAGNGTEAVPKKAER